MPQPVTAQPPASQAIVPLHEIPLAEVLAHPDAPGWMAWDWDRKHASGWADMERRLTKSGLRATPPAAEWNGYRLVTDGLWPDGALAALAGDGSLAGGILDGNLFVCRPYRGRGLAATLVALAFELGIKRPGDRVQLSEGGRATRRAAHRLAVARALAEGMVPLHAVLGERPSGPAPAVQALWGTRR